ncbi:MAG: glucose-6-phosphate dehydrogenase assembly protein OpcA [Acidothermaceae bacterium]
MNVDLSNTKSSAVLTALTDARHRSGTAALGMVLTLVVVVDEVDHHDALRAATAAAREHPCRIVTVIRRTASSPARLDAEIRVGDENSLAEIVVLRLYGELRNQADSIVLPLLLPDAPVLVWWPDQGPPIPSRDALGLLAQRRVTDAASSSKPAVTLKARSADHSPGDTDLAWTRLTPWRTLLAAALDQPFDPIVAGEVGAARNNPSAELLATWLENRLDVPVTRKVTRGPGITNVQLLTTRGEITITRPDGRLATLVRTGQPDRAVALPRRTTEELMAEELRRLDPDDIYNETIRRVFSASPKAKADVEKPARATAGKPATGGTRKPTGKRTRGEVVAPVLDLTKPRQSTTAQSLAQRPLMPPSKRAPESVTASARPKKSSKQTAVKKSVAQKSTAKKPAAKKSATQKPARKGTR